MSSFQHKLLELGRILRPVALRPAVTFIVTVPCSEDLLPVLEICTLPPQKKPPTLSANEAIFFYVVRHVLNTADLFSELLTVALVIIGGLDKTDLPGGIQVEIVIQTLILCVSHHGRKTDLPR